MRMVLSASGQSGCAHARPSRGSLQDDFLWVEKEGYWILPGWRRQCLGVTTRCAGRQDRRRHSRRDSTGQALSRPRYCFGNSIRTISEFC